MKINVVLRTCDKVSLQNDRIFPKNECVIRCLRSLVAALENYGNYSLHIIDDNSSEQTEEKIKEIAKNATFDFLPKRFEEHLNGKQKSRFSVKVAYNYIEKLPESELVYIVEDDYLHYPDSITKMIEAWTFFSSFDNSISFGIFPQDFVELHLHPQNLFNETYVQPCITLRGPDRYYRTTWFTHESFLIQKKIIDKYKDDFDKLMEIGTKDGAWEGTSLTHVWTKPDVKMLMPLQTLVLHISKKTDIPFYCKDLSELWENNKWT